jgi:hypothetical protein
MIVECVLLFYYLYFYFLKQKLAALTEKQTWIHN